MPFKETRLDQNQYEKAMPLIKELLLVLPKVPNLSPTQRALMEHFDTEERVRLEALLQTALLNPDLIKDDFPPDVVKEDIETYLRLIQLRQVLESCRDQIDTLLNGKLSHNRKYAEKVHGIILDKLQFTKR